MRTTIITPTSDKKKPQIKKNIQPVKKVKVLLSARHAIPWILGAPN